MSEYHFAASQKPVSKRVAAKRNKIAREVGGKGCGFVSVDTIGLRGSWGFAPNRGLPFDRETAEEIKAAWDKAGVGIDKAPAPASDAGAQRPRRT